MILTNLNMYGVFVHGNSILENLEETPSRGRHAPSDMN